MLNPRGILFDLDGTLVDTSRDITSNIDRAFESMEGLTFCQLLSFEASY